MLYNRSYCVTWQALQEAEKHAEARVVVDDLLTFNSDSTNTNDDILEELMRASMSTHEAARVLDDMLNTKIPNKMGHKSNTVEEPNKLVEEIMKDKDASPEVRNKLINDIAAKATVSFEQDDTLSMLMMEAKENPLAAQILHDMLSGNNQ